MELFVSSFLCRFLMEQAVLEGTGGILMSDGDDAGEELKIALGR